MRLNKEQSIEILKKIIKQIESGDKIIVEQDQYVFENGNKYPTIITVKIESDKSL